MTFDQETHPRLRFERNPLKVVVAQIRFPAAHRLGTAEAHDEIQRAVADRLPRAMPPVQEVTFALTPQGPSPVQIEGTAVRFGDEGGQRIVAIGPDMASFETTHYVGWEDFAAELRRLLDLVGRVGGPTEISRFGLRYVDEIVIDGVTTIDAWAGLLADNLLGDDESLARDPRTVLTAQRTTLRIGEDFVNVRHGFTHGQDANGALGSVYVIDTDIYTEQAQPLDIDQLMERAERYHGWMTNIFGRSLTAAGIDRLGGAEQ